MLAIDAVPSFEVAGLGVLPGLSIDVGAITQARTQVGQMLDMLVALPAEMQKRTARPEATFFAFKLDRAANLDRYVSGAQLTILSALPILQPMPLVGSNVILWPNNTWDQQLNAWQTLAVFANLRTSDGALVTFALERGSVEKVISATRDFLGKVDAQLQLAKIPTKRRIWPFVLAGVGAAAVIGGSAYAMRDKPLPAQAKRPARRSPARQLGAATTMVTRRRVPRVARFVGAFLAGTSASVVGGATSSWIGRRVRGTNGDVLLELGGWDLVTGTIFGLAGALWPEAI